MPLLIEDLTEEAAASATRTADRLDTEARELEALASAPDDKVKARAVASARQAANLAIALLPQARAAWASAFDALARKPPEPEAIRLLRGVLAQLEAGLRVMRAPRTLWAIAQRLGASPERLDEIDRARLDYEVVAIRARKALSHKENGWRPADPERFALAMERARQGPFVPAEEAIRRFTRPETKDL
jgi:hypothetical protein